MGNQRIIVSTQVYFSSFLSCSAYINAVVQVQEYEDSLCSVIIICTDLSVSCLRVRVLQLTYPQARIANMERERRDDFRSVIRTWSQDDDGSKVSFSVSSSNSCRDGIGFL